MERAEYCVKIINANCVNNLTSGQRATLERANQFENNSVGDQSLHGFAWVNLNDQRRLLIGRATNPAEGMIEGQTPLEKDEKMAFAASALTSIEFSKKSEFISPQSSKAQYP